MVTPETAVRSTGTWLAGCECFMTTPRHLMKGLPRRLPGLDESCMLRQWVQPGGALRTGLATNEGQAKRGGSD
jgi:hypothetical protein